MFFWTKLAFRGPVGCIPAVVALCAVEAQNDNSTARRCVWAANRVYWRRVIELTPCSCDPAISRLQNDCRSHISVRRPISLFGLEFGGEAMQTGAGFSNVFLIYRGSCCAEPGDGGSCIAHGVLRRLLLKMQRTGSCTRSKPQVAQTPVLHCLSSYDAFLL